MEDMMRNTKSGWITHTYFILGIDFADLKGLIASPGYEICDFLKQSNSFTNINYEERHIPVGPMGGGKIADLVRTEKSF